MQIYDPQLDKMLPRERVARTLARREADRVPVDYSSNTDIDRRLKAHFGLTSQDDEGLLLSLGVDFRDIWPRYRGPQLHPDKPGRMIDEWGIHREWIEHSSGGYWDFCDWPLAEATEAEVAAWPLPSPDDYDYEDAARRAEAASDYCVVIGGAGVGDIINATGMLRTMEQVLVDLASDEPAGLLLIERRQRILLEVARRTLEATRRHAGLFFIGEDLGTQRGPTISVPMFRKHIRPWMQQFVTLGRSYDLPVMIHSCGSSSWAFPDFLEMGITVVDTLQPEAEKMAPAYLKQEFGDRLSFHGMISTAGPLAYGTPEDVEKVCHETLITMMPGGGYCLAPTHSIQDNSPTENVLTMYRTAHRIGRYS